jgi:hypothetical protein
MKKLLNGILVDLTQEEIAQSQLDIQKENIRIENEKKAIAEKEDKEAQEQANKQSALNKLKALGLNDAEINAILGL